MYSIEIVASGAVMFAYAMHLLRTTSTLEVLVHPNGEHGKQFDFVGWLSKQGFERTSQTGKTAYAGRYVLAGGPLSSIRLQEMATSLRAPAG